MDRVLGGVPHSHLDPSLRSLSMDTLDSVVHPLHHHHPHHHHHTPNRQSLPGLKSMESYAQDPYSFVDEMPNAIIPHPMGPNHVSSQVKKRGRKKKSEINTIRNDNNSKGLREELALDPKERKRHDRFNGLSEAEVSQRTLPDHLTSNLDILIVGINPGLFAAFKGHHYAGPGNHFWKCLHLSGLVPEPLTAEDDYTLVHYGIGFTNMVARPTKGSADLTRREIKQGSQILLEKIQKYQPKIAVFNGKLIYEVFSGKKDFPFGRQSELVDGTNTHIWVMPSSSARCAQLPRAADKVPFYQALKKFKDYLNGLIPELDDSEITFSESKSVTKSPNCQNGETKCIPTTPSLGRGGGGDDQCGGLPEKKKRGRPRKGMEKQPPKDKKEKKEQQVVRPNEDRNSSDRFGSDRLQDVKKRRGRPKKPKMPPNTNPAISSLASNMGTTTPPDMLETNTQTSIGTVQPQTASSVSSGYSTGTSASCEDRRRDDNGSGSGGPSPSHHSFTTQSDLSSEISAAISCGSPQTPPCNPNQSDSFDTSGGTNGGHAHNGSKLQSPSNSLQSSQNCRPQVNPFSSSQGHSNTLESHDSYAQHAYYDNRSNNVNNNRTQQQTFQQTPNVNNQRESLGESMQPQTYHNSYEPKVIDVATKSLSGLESLVDQIPSIADVDLPPVTNGGCLGLGSESSISHLGGGGSGTSYSSSSEAGFLPYSHHGPTSTYGSTSSHYASPPYYASDLSSTFPVNSLGPTYCSPSAPSGLMFGYPGYSQYTSSTTAYPHSAGSGLHLSPGYAPPGYSPYPSPSHYTHMRPPTSTPTQRFGQRLHLRQDGGMDLGHMGYGGY